MKTKTNYKNVKALKDRIRMAENLLSVDESNKRLIMLAPKERAVAEIKDRVLNGINDKEKDALVSIYDDLLAIIVEYFKQNKTPRCPLKNYIHLLKAMGIRPTSFFELVVRNDGAIYRWHKKESEWENFTRTACKEELVRAKAALERALKSNDSEEENADVSKIFDGKI